MSFLRILFFVVLLVVVGTIAGCSEERLSRVELSAIDYSLYGPYEMDVVNQ